MRQRSYRSKCPSRRLPLIRQSVRAERRRERERGDEHDSIVIMVHFCFLGPSLQKALVGHKVEERKLAHLYWSSHALAQSCAIIFSGNFP